jgi:hypothetical protein
MTFQESYGRRGRLEAAKERYTKTAMRQFIKQLFSESGEASFSRTGSFVALVLSCIWVTFIVWRTQRLPNLESLTVFIGTLYGLGKAGETVQRIGGKKQG